MNEGLQLRVAHRAGIIALDNGARLRWTLSARRRHVRLPVPSCASQQGLILAIVVILRRNDVLNLDFVPVPDVVHHLIALKSSERERLHSRTCQDMRTPTIHMLERHLEYREETNNAAPMYPAQTKTLIHRT